MSNIPLIQSVIDGDIEEVRNLLKTTEINTFDISGNAPLLSYCIQKDTDITRFLLTSGPNPTFKTTSDTLPSSIPF